MKLGALDKKGIMCLIDPQAHVSLTCSAPIMHIEYLTDLCKVLPRRITIATNIGMVASK